MGTFFHFHYLVSYGTPRSHTIVIDNIDCVTQSILSMLLWSTTDCTVPAGKVLAQQAEGRGFKSLSL